MMNIKRIGLVIIAALVLQSCHDDDGGNSPAPPQLQAINLDNQSVAEGRPAGTLVGQLSVADDANAQFTLRDDADGLFRIIDSRLEVARNGLDFDVAQRHRIEVVTNDGALAQNFVIDVIDQRFISGVISKGPFSSVIMQVAYLERGVLVQQDVKPVIEQTPSNVEGTQTNFQVFVEPDANVVLQVLGSFTNELSGNTTTLVEPLTAFLAGGGDQQQNINVVSHMIASAAVGLIQQGSNGSEALASATQRLRGLLGFQADDDLTTLDVNQVADGADENNPHLRMVLLSASVMNLPQNNGRMPSQWDDLNVELAQGDGNPFGVFSGINNQRLLNRLNTSGVYDLPEVQLQEGVWVCQLLCDYVDPTPGIYLADVSVYEGRGQADVLVRREGDTTSPVDVLLSFQGKGATLGEDFDRGLSRVTIPAGSSEAVAELGLVIDQKAESNEKIGVSVLNVSDGSEVVRGDADITLLDNVPSTYSGRDASAIAIDDQCLIAVGDPQLLVGKPCTNATAEFVLADGKPQAVRLSALLRSQCQSDDLICLAETQFWQVDMALVSEGAAGAETGRVALGSYLYSGADVARQSDAADAGNVQFTASLADTATEQFLTTARTNGDNVVVELSLSGDLRTADVNFPGSRVIEPELLFGDRFVPFVPSNTSLEAGGGSCAADEFRLLTQIPRIEQSLLDTLINGSDTTAAAVAGLFSNLLGLPADVCVTLDNALPPRATVTQGDINLNGSFWQLPAGHGVVRLVSDNSGRGRLVPAAPATRVWPIDTQSGGVQMVVDGLPISFLVSNARLTQAGFQIDYSGISYLQKPVFSSSDTRATAAFVSNDIHFDTSASGAVTVGVDGVTGEMQLGQINNRFTAIPFGRLFVAPRTVAVSSGQIVSGTAQSVFAIEQSTSCQLAGCDVGPQEVSSAEGLIDFDPRGRAFGSLTAAVASQPAIGTLPSGEPAFQRPNDLPVGAAITFASAGYAFDPSLPVAAQLAGHIQKRAQNAELVLHDTRSVDFRRGNYAPVGLSVGPEIYADANGQPSVGNGRDLNEVSTVQRLNGAASVDLPSATATKYVIRSHGLTGVFNADIDGNNAEFDLYGYPLTFNRFAFRFVNNEIDRYNWIDGHLPLPGDADLNEIAFTNLGLDCAGRYSSGNLVFEACDASDDNGNGLVDENCPTLLGAFKMDTTVNAMRFADAGGQPLSCGSNAADLVLSHTLNPLVLNKPLSVDFAWTPEGRLAGFQEVKGLGSYLLDQRQRGEDFGFPVTLKNAVFEVKGDFAGRYGYMQGEKLTALPFWEALEGDYRIANTFDADFSDSGAAPAPTLLTPSGLITDPASNPLNGVNFDQFNTFVSKELRDLAKNDELAIADRGMFDAAYRWGNTGIGFQLPVYFSPGEDNGDEALPTFIGVKRQYSNLVLDVNAGINFIEPVRTKFSFGASADITPLLELEFKIDLNNADSLDKLDQTLVKLKIVDRPLFAPLFNEAKDYVDIFNQFADRGIDDLTEKALLASIRQLGEAAAPVSPANEDPFVTVAKGLGVIKTLPDQVLGLVDTQVVEPLFNQMDSASETLRAPLLEMRSNLLALPENLSHTDPSFTQSKQRIDTLSAEIKGFGDKVAQLKQNADAKFSSVDGIFDKASLTIADVNNSLNSVEDVLTQAVEVVDAVCQSDNAIGTEANGFLTDFFDKLETTQQLVDFVQGTEVLVPLIELAADDPATRSSLQKSQEQLQAKAEILLGRLNDAETALRGALCDSSVELTLRQANAVLSTIRSAALQAETQISSVRSQLQFQYGRATGLFDLYVIEPFDRVSDQLDTIAREFEAAQRETRNLAVTGQQMLTDLETALFDEIPLLGANRIAVVGGIDSNFQNQDVFYAATLLVKQEVSKVRSDIRNELDEAFNQVLPGGGFTPDELRSLLVAKLMESTPVRKVREEANTALVEIRRQINELIASLTDQINNVVTPLVAKVEDTVNEKLNEAQSALGELPVQAGKVDGYAVVNGNELERAHIGAEWTMAPAADGEPGKQFKAALDAVSLSLTDEAAGCDIPPDESPLEITISAYNLPMGIGPSSLTAEKIYLGFVIDQAGVGDDAFVLPEGVFGGIHLRGEIALTEFKVYDPAFAAGIGKREIYLGARAGAVFSAVSVEAAFLAGKLCDNDVLLDLDPQVARFIPIPENGFAGAYVRGAASIPVWTMGCPLTIGVAADVGAWILAGPPTTIGGLVGGGAFGKVGCIGALRGQIRATGSVTTEGDIAFAGQGFGVAGVGLCEPAGWTSVERSREDGLCATVDAIFTAGYVNGWSVFDLGVSGPH